MKMLFKSKRTHRRYPKHRILLCSNCHSLMYAGIWDCYQGKSVLGIDAIYVDCPNCKTPHHYHDGFMSEALHSLNGR